MSVQSVRVGDEVQVIAGKDKGRSGRVLRVIKRPGARGKDVRRLVVVEGLNMHIKHVRPNPQRGVEGGRLSKETPMDVSNVALLNPMTKRPDRVGVKVLADGEKKRVFKSNDELVEV